MQTNRIRRSIVYIFAIVGDNIMQEATNYRINYEIGGIVYLSLEDEDGRDIAMLKLSAVKAMKLSLELTEYTRKLF